MIEGGNVEILGQAHSSTLALMHADFSLQLCVRYQRALPDVNKSVAMIRSASPVLRNNLARPGAFLHSPVRTPDSVAVMIINIWNSPHPTEVPRGPRNVVLMPYRANAPIQRIAMRDDQSVSGKGARNADQLRLRRNKYTEYAAFGRNPPASPTGHTEYAAR